MTLRHASPLHREDDPGGLIGEAFAMGPDFPGPAEDLLLSWMLGLPADTDATAAARRLLKRYAASDDPLPDDPRGRLLELLRQTADAKSVGSRSQRRGRRGQRAQASEDQPGSSS